MFAHMKGDLMSAAITQYSGNVTEDVSTLVDWLSTQLCPSQGQIDAKARDRDDYKSELFLAAMTAAGRFRERFGGTYTAEKRYVAKSLWNAYRNFSSRRWHGYTTVSLESFLTFETEGLQLEGYYEARDELRHLADSIPIKSLENLVRWEFDRPDERDERQRLRRDASAARMKIRQAV